MKLKEIFEIAAAVLAAFGLYNLLDRIKQIILYPKQTRVAVVAAVFEEDMNTETETYIEYLRREGKISEDGLIILSKYGTMNGGNISVKEVRTDGIRRGKES